MHLCHFKNTNSTAVSTFCRSYITAFPTQLGPDYSLKFKIAWI